MDDPHFSEVEPLLVSNVVIQSGDYWTFRWLRFPDGTVSLYPVDDTLWFL